MATSMFGGASEQEMLDKLLGGGPELEDFVSSSPQDLPSFDHAKRNEQASENRMEYAIYVDWSPSGQHERQSTAANLAQLQEVRRSILDGAAADVSEVCSHTNATGRKSIGDEGGSTSKRLVSQHLWQSEAFGINEPRLGDSALHGSMHFGDCIDDEWLVVWLLLNATKRDPRLSITVRDNDGEFILIETSPAWPASLDWLDPNCSENRVWLRGGRLHIIDSCDGQDDHGGADSPNNQEIERSPLPLDASLEVLRRAAKAGKMVELVGLTSRTDLNGRLGRAASDINPKTGRLAVSLCPLNDGGNSLASVTATVETVCVRPESTQPALRTPEVEAAQKALPPPMTKTVAPPAVRSVLDSRLAAAREAAATCCQRVHMVLPAQLAFLLYHRPNLVSRAVAAFYLREPEDLSAAAKARRFGPLATSRGRIDSEPFAGTAKSLAPVKVTVTLTRCLHAQLEQQGAAFAPPQHLANAWKNHLTRSSDKIKSKDSPSTESAWLCPETETNDFEFEEAVGDFSSFERGLRLTAAFEMLYQAGRRSVQDDANFDQSQMIPADADLLRLPLDKISSAIDAVITTGDTLDWERLGHKNEHEATVARMQDWLVEMSQEPVDGDEWMNVSPEEMEAMLRQGAPPPISVQEASAAKEDVPQKDDLQAGAQKLQDIVEGVHNFLDGSGEALRGAELPAPLSADTATSPVSFDVEKFMGLLGGVGSSSTGADDNLFNDEDSVDDDSNEEGDDKGAGNINDGNRLAGGDRIIKPDEDDEDVSEDDAQEFTGAYYSHMDRELDDSEILAKSFERQANVDGDPSSDSLSSSGAQLVDSSDRVSGGEENGQEHQSVDLDANLVKHLLESFASQEGLAGPASNLLQELGTFFPAQAPQETQSAGAAPQLSGIPERPPTRSAPESSTSKGSTIEFMYELD